MSKMLILIHSSKTMHHLPTGEALGQPSLLSSTNLVMNYLKTLSIDEIEAAMGVSPKLAAATKDLIAQWNTDPLNQTAAIDSFAGDIYSGLQTHEWTAEDRAYANQKLRILSGLYGILKPLDGIQPYRLEMGYKLPDQKYRNLYKFWGDTVAQTLEKSVPIINLAAVEYSKVVTEFIDPSRVLTPRFLTVGDAGTPTFVVVHSKIARGAFASWIIRNRITDPDALPKFTEIGYSYDPVLSTKSEPVFICKNFGGIGLSVRLRNKNLPREVL